jgi:hypothetical protein
MTTRRRRVWLVAAVLVAAALWWRGGTAPAPSAASQVAVRSPASVRSAARSVVPAGDTAELNRELQDPAQVAKYLALYKQANHYAPTTLRLLPGMDDALEPDRRFATDTPVMRVRNLYTRPSHRLYYRFETDKIRYVAPEPIELKLTVFRGDEARAPIDVTVGPVSVSHIDRAGQSTALGTVTLVQISTGVYAARYAPARGSDPGEDEVLQLEVTWQLADGTGKPVHDRMLIHDTPAPAASFTGRFTDQLEDGSLRVDVEVDSTRAGAAQISANLFGSDGEPPVATALASPTLPRGRSWVTLSFYGLALRERGISGPYVVKTVRGHFPSTTSAGRGGEIARFAGSYTTHAYPLSSFTTQEWDSPDKRAGIAAYETELARLRARP